MRGLFAATALGRGVVLPVAFLAVFRFAGFLACAHFFTVAIGHHRYHGHNLLGIDQAAQRRGRRRARTDEEARSRVGGALHEHTERDAAGAEETRASSRRGPVLTPRAPGHVFKYSDYFVPPQVDCAAVDWSADLSASLSCPRLTRSFDARATHETY